jgi:hypothetical protein
MALKFSTGFRDALLDTNDLKTLFDGGFIKVYSGTVPANADAARSGATELVMYTVDDDGTTGLDLDTAAASGAIAKAPAQTWSGTAGASGTATFWRYEQTGDTGNASTTELRIQGTIGGAGADLFVSSTTFSSATLYTIDFFSLSIPVPA